MHKLTGLVLLAIGTAGCGTFVTDTPINASPRALAPRPPESVEVFTSGPPTAPHVDVVLLEVEQTHDINDQGTDIMIQRLRERAGQIGCDGVVVGGFREYEGQRGNFLDKDSTKMEATCIVYMGEPTILPPVPPRTRDTAQPPPAPSQPPPIANKPTGAG